MDTLMSGLVAESYDRAYADRVLIGRILRYFRPQRGVLLFAFVLIMVTSLLETAFPLLVSQLLDTLGWSPSFSALALFATFILLAGIGSWGANFLRQRSSARAVGEVVLHLRTDAMQHVLALDLSFHDAHPAGAVVSRITSDTEAFSTTVTLTLDMLSQCLLCALIIIVLFFRSVPLALVMCAIVPAIVCVALGFRRIARRASRHSQRAFARLNTAIHEVISGITIAKNFRQEQQMYDEFRQVNDQTYQVNVREGFLYNSIFPLLLTVANLGTALIVYVGGTSVLDRSITLGTWYLFVQAIALLWSPLTSLASFWSLFQLGLAASERVFALLDAEPQVRQRDAQPVGKLAGGIAFQHLFFSYDNRKPVLADFTLTIQPGETVALIGHTGAGKSSIGKLIARFYEFQEGDLLIDGHDIRTLDLDEYHRALGIVPQAPWLFSGTVAENIRYARPEASAAEVAGVTRRIGRGDWLEALPEGLETQVGETGRALSLGQRQLVALARVLLQDPTILILDEATASVDPFTEAHIQEGLEVLLKARTCLLIAHRLATIRHADRIIVLDHGCIVEEGDHASLLARRGAYAQLYNTALRHQSPDYQPGQGFVPEHTPATFCERTDM